MELLWIIIGMAIVTSGPRMLPAWLLDRVKPSSTIEAWLAHVPYAVLGALIFPGIMTVNADRPLIGLGAGVVAAILAWFRLHMLLVIAAAMAVVMAVRWLGL